MSCTRSDDVSLCFAALISVHKRKTNSFEPTSRAREEDVSCHKPCSLPRPSNLCVLRYCETKRLFSRSIILSHVVTIKVRPPARIFRLMLWLHAIDPLWFRGERVGSTTPLTRTDGVEIFPIKWCLFIDVSDTTTTGLSSLTEPTAV